ncbi:MAG: hypothetical protein WCJ62_03915, partial [Flavobacterium sp.]
CLMRLRRALEEFVIHGPKLFIKNKTVKDHFVPIICLLAPAICLYLNINSKLLFGNYTIGNELIILNGLLTFIGLVAISKPATTQTKF